MRVTVIGTGYVGLITGACFAYLGSKVICVDSDRSKIQQLSDGKIPIFEPHLEEFLALAAQRGGIRFTADIHEAVNSDVIFIAVGTPSLPGGAPDLKHVESAARAIGRGIKGDARPIIVNKSTVPVGSGNLVEMLIREGREDAAGEGFTDPIQLRVVSNPEFLQEGNAISNSLYPDRIVIGAEKADALAVITELYRPIVEQTFPAPEFLPRPAGLVKVPLFMTSLTSAEMIKYAANSFLAMKISFSNEMANICERVGAECREVMKGIGLDDRIGPRFLNAGVGWGGSCFGKDLRALTQTAHEYGYRPLLLEAVQEVNEAQRKIVIQKLQEKLFILKGRTVGLLGLAFKPGTDDLREAPSLTIAKRLVELGARVKAYDPVAMKACRQQNPDLNIQYCDSATAAARGADAIVLVTEWEEFRHLDLAQLSGQMSRPVMIDGRGVFDAAEARRAGFEYSGIGSIGVVSKTTEPHSLVTV